MSNNLKFFSGTAFSIFGYLSPVKGVLQVMVLAILLDLILGVFAAVKRGEGICSKKLWRTGYKLLFSIILVSLMYMIDKEMQIIELHKTLAWFITGFEVWSMLESMGDISDHSLFRLLKTIMRDRVKKQIGTDIGKDNDNTTR